MRAWLLMLLVVVGCEKSRFSEQDLKLTQDGAVIGDVHETVRITGRGGEQVQRNITLARAPKDTVLELADLDKDGFALNASYRREGPKGKRYVELRGREIFSRGNDEKIVLGGTKPVVLWSLLHRVKVKEPREIVLVDLENAIVVETTLGATPARVKPTANDPVKPEHTQPAPFLESTAPKVVSWCKMQGAGSSALDAAKSVALAVKPKISEEKAGGPPAALNMFALGGGDESAAALLVTCLRALGHPARVVHSQTRTWGQVHDGTRWRDVDPTVDQPVLDDASSYDVRGEGLRGHL
jgi:hypothetical protein